MAGNMHRQGRSGPIPTYVTATLDGLRCGPHVCHALSFRWPEEVAWSAQHAHPLSTCKPAGTNSRRELAGCPWAARGSAALCCAVLCCDERLGGAPLC